MTIFCSIALRSRYNSSRDSTDFPRNYLANLTYEKETSHPMEITSSFKHHIQVVSRYVCGSARKFLLPDGSHQDFVTLTCQWDKTWSLGIVQEIPVMICFCGQLSITYGCFKQSKANINIHRDITSSLRLGGLSSTPAAPLGVKPKSGLVRLRFLSFKIYEIFRTIGETLFSFIRYHKAS